MRPEELDGLLSSLPDTQSSYVRACGFSAVAGERPLLLPGDGVAGAVLGLGADHSAAVFGDLNAMLPDGVWRLVPGSYDAGVAVLGFCLGAYVFERRRVASSRTVLLVPPAGTDRAVSLAAAMWMARDLINTPANELGPEELAAAVAAVGEAAGAKTGIVRGERLAREYPALAAVGAGSCRPPCVATLHWRGSGAGDEAPLVSLCGKGVVFDTGGLDLKPSAAMLRMKKDMGGAAILLGVARLLMEQDLPIRLALRVGCVENATSGGAMRPGDVLPTRSGLRVEIGNTDAEGRLVLADLITAACEERPTVLIDCATLTGAARVATGPDLPALFCNDEQDATALLAAGRSVADPLWRLPLWAEYDAWLSSPVADLNNISTKPFAGAIVAALFLQRFVSPGLSWVHIDAYAWNDVSRPGRPEGGEAQTLRAIVTWLTARFEASAQIGPPFT